MAIPAVPVNFSASSGDTNNFIIWDIDSGATSYVLQRSTDGVTFSTLETLSVSNPGSGTPWNYYLDAGANVSPVGPVVGTQYWYQVQAVNGSGSSAFTSPVAVVTVDVGQVSLGYLRFQAKSRCDRINSQFVTNQEWNQYATEARKQLYNIVTQAFGNDYYSSSTYTWTLGNGLQVYPLPSDFYKLNLVEVALNPMDSNSWVTLRSYNWAQKNLYNYPNVYTFYGITNLRYRLVGNNLNIVPQPTGGQTLRMWYTPRPKTLLADTDMVDGISGWEEFVIVTMAMFALIKEESDTASDFKALRDEQRALIEEAAEHRDIGEPQSVTDSKRRNFSWTDDDGYGTSGLGGM